MAKVICKASLKKIVNDSAELKMEPRLIDVVFWYSELNRLLFAGKLPDLKSIHIGKRRGALGEVSAWQYHHGHETQYNLKVHHKFESLKKFLSMLAHEMVHVFQYENEGVMTHGPSFHAWEKKIKSFGLEFGTRL